MLDHCKRLKFGSVVADSNINEFVAGLCHQLLYDHRYEPAGYFRKKEVTRDQRLTLNSGFGNGSIWIPVRPPKNTHFALVNGSFKLFRYCIWFSQEALIMRECRIDSLNQHSTASFQGPICLSPAVIKVSKYIKKSQQMCSTQAVPNHFKTHLHQTTLKFSNHPPSTHLAPGWRSAVGIAGCCFALPRHHGIHTMDPTELGIRRDASK